VFFILIRCPLRRGLKVPLFPRLLSFFDFFLAFLSGMGYGFELEVAIVATGEEEFSRYVAMVPHLVVVVCKRLFTIATYRRGFELCLLFSRERQHFDIVRNNPIYNVQFVKNMLIEDVHHVVGSAVQCWRGLILGV